MMCFFITSYTGLTKKKFLLKVWDWTPKEKSHMMLAVPSVAVGLPALKSCHWISFTPYKIWIRRLKQIWFLTSSTHVKLFLFFFWPCYPTTESDNLCPVSTAAILPAKSLKMTVSLLWHVIAWLACTLNDFCTIVTHWFLDMIYSFWFIFPFDMPTCPKCSLICLYWQLCKFLKYFQLNSLLIVGSNASQQNTNYTQVSLCCKGHFYVRLISQTSQGDNEHCPAESWCHCLDLSHRERPNKQPEICWTQWRTQLKWQTRVLSPPVHFCSLAGTNNNTSFLFVSQHEHHVASVFFVW